MSQITSMQRFTVLLFVGLWAIAGCSNPNSESRAVFDTETQSHAADWLPAVHMMKAEADLNICAGCHGADFGGGISGVACTSCHLGNETHVHPLDWGEEHEQHAINHGPYALSKGNTACANVNCHGANLAGVANSGPSCTSCHLGGVNSAHPADWDPLTYVRHVTYVEAYGNTSCTNAACHGTSLTGVTGSGPSCTACHIGGVDSAHPADWDPYTYVRHAVFSRVNGNTSCANAACHGVSLAGVAESGPSCTSCHIGGVNSVHPTAWAGDLTQHGTYAYNNGTGSCQNVFCHGAQLEGVAFSGPGCSTCH